MVYIFYVTKLFADYFLGELLYIYIKLRLFIWNFCKCFDKQVSTSSGYLKNFQLQVSINAAMLLLLGGSTCLWSIYYLCINFFNNKRTSEWNCRLVALTHSLVVCRLVEYFVFLESWPLYRLGGPNTNGEYTVLYFSGSYFIFDLIWSLYTGSEGPVMLAHHLICVIGLPLIINTGLEGASVVFCIWGGELTNPFLQARWFLRETNNKDSKWAWWNDLIFALLFFIIRAGVFSVLVYNFYFSTSHFIIKMLGYAFYFVGLIWCVRIFSFARKKLMQ